MTLSRFLIVLPLLLAMSSFNAKAASPIPAAPGWMDSLDALYDDQLRAPGLDQRNFSPEHWWEIAAPMLAPRKGFKLREIGRSVEDRPLRHVSWGTGKTSILLWSQMHGDESTATMALADLFRFLGEHPRHPIVRRLSSGTTLHFFPIVNPDGAAAFRRRNAQGIDINRDARALATPEAQTLKQLRDRLQPTFGFNLHDQQPGYRAGDSDRAVAIALLAPPFDESRGINEVRNRAMHVAAGVRIALEPYIAGHMARWDDTFNPRAFGDLTTQWGTSTVLIEAGGIEGDPEKQQLRKLYFLGLVAALDSIASDRYREFPTTLYSKLPENGEVWPDLRIDNATLAIPGQPRARIDLLVNFREPLAWRGGSIRDIGDLGGTGSPQARRVIDARGLFLVPATDSSGKATRIAPGAPAHFHLSRDPQGHDIVWTLARDLDPGNPPPGAGH